MSKLVFLIICVMMMMGCFVEGKPRQKGSGGGHSHKRNAELMNKWSVELGERFAGWQRGMGVETHRDLEIGYFKGIGMGMKCKKGIGAGSEVLRVPFDAGISESTVRLSKLAAVWKGKEGEGKLDRHAKMALFVLWQRMLGSKSRWGVYLSTIPRVYTNVLYATREQLELLEKSPRRKSAEFWVRDFDEQFKLVRKLVGETPGVIPLSRVNRDAFRWAYSTVLSRTWKVPNFKGEKEIVLVPVADLMNHDPELPIDGRAGLMSSLKGKAFVMESVVDCEEGGQMFVSYGEKTNGALMFQYGFVPLENPSEFLTVNLSDTNLIKNEKLLKQHGMLQRVLRLYGNNLPPRLLSTMRMNEVNEAEWESGEFLRTLDDRPINRENEIRALKSIVELSEWCLRNWYQEAGIEKEEIALKKRALDGVSRGLLMLKMEEKKLLRNVGLLGKRWIGFVVSAKEKE